jgi:Rha family phage regulatory protein
MNNQKQPLTETGRLELIKASLENSNNKIVTSSLDMATVFDKEHFNVLESIKKLILESREEKDNFGDLNFQVSSYKSEQNKPLPMYYITRDGFTLLAMGFTGSEAMKFKKEYIKQFNKMEEELKKGKKPQTYIEALKELVAAEEEKERLLLENKQTKEVLQVKEALIDNINVNILPQKGEYSLMSVAESFQLYTNNVVKKGYAKNVIHKEALPKILETMLKQNEEPRIQANTNNKYYRSGLDLIDIKHCYNIVLKQPAIDLIEEFLSETGYVHSKGCSKGYYITKYNQAYSPNKIEIYSTEDYTPDWAVE